MTLPGPAYALIAALLFGISPPLSKLLIGELSPQLLAGLLYLGSGVGLTGVVLASVKGFQPLRGLTRSGRLKLLGAIAAGGILAPLCLTLGIQKGSAFEVSLLLNLELVMTTLLARFIFKEQVGRAVWAATLVLLLGSPLIGYDPKSATHFSLAALLVALACFFWGVDNNLTRDLEDLPPAVLACAKGWVAGTFNTALGIALFHGLFRWASVAGSLLVGAFSYGVSLVFFILALRRLGSARAASYFATGPFFGMFASLILLGERPAPYQWGAAVLIGLGLWVLSRENHEHAHAHESLTHSHVHVHDDHHRHSHNGSEGPEPHEHLHRHEPLTHSHPHVPDIHHRHSH